eukprot:TRINITY_DN13896_c0_g1_i1.p1 TRINITY_DN13896_c0_g1~~TRINITY_DN13896_c0_g1_i1.p1  ORF type:complete len:273 (-),score=73.79 TRINITY_DN13896_c0_g1_i1:147-965(-)
MSLQASQSALTVFNTPQWFRYGAAVAAAVRAEATPEPSLASSFGALLLAVIKSVLLTVVGSSQAAMLHRSAVFLIVFLVIHMLGNLTFLVSDDAFNAYGHKLETLRPATTAIEAYLLLAAVVHGFTALAASWRKKATITKAPWSSGKLFLTSLLVSVFAVVHVKQFRFGPAIAEGYATTVEGTRVRDLARLQREVLSDPVQVGIYLASLCAIGAHVWFGWAKAVPKLQGLAKEHRASALLIGQVLTVVVVAGLALGPLSVVMAKSGVFKHEL